MHAEWQHLASAASIIAALDLDGTLLPFAPTPQEAVIDGDTAALIDQLSKCPGVTFGIISGRPRALVEDLNRRLPHIALAAEHGVWRYASAHASFRETSAASSARPFSVTIRSRVASQ